MARKNQASTAVNITPEILAAGRKPLAPAEQRGPEFVGATPPAIAQAEAAMNLALRGAEATVRAVAATLGYQLPADCTDPDLIQRDIAANMRRSVEACLEVGRGLAVLKAACDHGQFTARLEVLGIDKHVAARFMQSAAKFSKLPTSATLKAIGNQSKLFEMLVLDDEQLEELELTGQTGELHLDDVATMSVKELRAAVREVREEKAAIERIAAERRDELDKLKVKDRKRVAADPWPQEVADLNEEIAGIGTVADEVMSKHLTFIDAVESLIDNAEEGSDKFRAAKSAIHAIGATVERLCHLAAGLREHYETRIGGYVADDKSHVLDAAA